MRSCAKVSAGGTPTCWYEVGTRKFECAGCDCAAAARAALNYCNGS
jgi:hypothetical protein